MLVHHGAEEEAKLGVDAEDDALAARFQAVYAVEGAERLFTVGVDVEVPGPQGVETQEGLAPLLVLDYDRDDVLLYSVVEGEAVFRRVVEALHGLELVVPVVCEACVGGYLLSDLVHAVVEGIEGAGVSVARLGAHAPCLLAGGPIGLLEEASQLGKRVDLPAELGLLGAADLLELLVELALLGEEGHVLLAENLHLGAHVA